MTLLDANTALSAPAPMPGNKNGPRIHGRKKLFQGRATAQEVHAKYAFPTWAKCQGCSKTHGLQVRAIVLCPVDYMKQHDPMFEQLMEVNPQKFQEILVQTKYGPFIRLTTTYSCESCSPALQKSLAKLPDYMIVDLNYGPGADKVVSGPQ